MKNCLKKMGSCKDDVLKEENSWVLSLWMIFALIFVALVLLFFLIQTFV